jgi:hypothetical protein
LRRRLGEETSVIAIQTFERGLSAVRCTNRDVKLRLEHDPTLPGKAVLVVDYPPRTEQPAGRDVWCDAENVDWTAARAITLQVRADQSIRLSVSFLDRNRIAYTSWADLPAGAWQTVRIPFESVRPNPYFQPPGADTSAPIDVSRVERIGFAPQSAAAGRLTIGQIVVE